MVPNCWWWVGLRALLRSQPAWVSWGQRERAFILFKLFREFNVPAIFRVYFGIALHIPHQLTPPPPLLENLTNSISACPCTYSSFCAKTAFFEKFGGSFSVESGDTLVLNWRALISFLFKFASTCIFLEFSQACHLRLMLLLSASRVLLCVSIGTARGRHNACVSGGLSTSNLHSEYG